MFLFFIIFTISKPNKITDFLIELKQMSKSIIYCSRSMPSITGLVIVSLKPRSTLVLIERTCVENRQNFLLNMKISHVCDNSNFFYTIKNRILTF